MLEKDPSASGDSLAKRTQDAYGPSQKGPFIKTLWLSRTFPVEQEQALLKFLQNKAVQVHSLRFTC